MRQNMSIEQLWQEQCEQIFQKVPEDHGQQEGKALKQFADEKVDQQRAKMDKELEDYRKEIERAKRFDKSKLLQNSEAKR